jgi:hypothetical protein
VKLRIILALLALAGVAASQRVRAQIVQAQFFGQYLGEPPGDPAPPPPGFDADEWGDQEAPTLPKARVCQKMCANDFSPCDPIYFKTEDGRCDGLDENR